MIYKKIKALSLISAAIFTFAGAQSLFAAEWDVWLTPVNQLKDANQWFSVELHMDTWSKNIWSFNYNINYDSTKITLDTTKWDNWIEKWADASNYLLAVNPWSNTVRVWEIVFNNFAEWSDVHLATLYFTTDTNFSTLANIDISVNEATDWSAVALNTWNVVWASVNYGLDTDWDWTVDSEDTDDDNDWISDIDEANNWTNPLLVDTDWDWIADNIEWTLDSDWDWIIDALESAIEDADSDGVPDSADAANDDPSNDSDWDWYSNADETNAWTSPTNPNSVPTDSDHDWLSDASDPDDNNPDSDWDGILDGVDADVNWDWVLDNGTDTDWDGINDSSDADVNWDWVLDNGTDSDNDWVNDSSDLVDNSVDTDWDWLPDAIDPNDNNPDTDWDGIPDGADVDVNWDGTPDNGTDTDWDGINDIADADDSPSDGTTDAGNTDANWDWIDDAYSFPVRADVDNSWIVTSSDAMLTLQKSVWIDVSSTAWFDTETTWDVTWDSNVSTADAMLILQYSVWTRTMVTALADIATSVWHDLRFR